MTDILIKILITWNVVGGVIFIILSANYYHSLDNRCILRPDFIYDSFNVNFFGCALLTLLFNLLCPIVTIVYWTYKFVHFICTVGR